MAYLKGVLSAVAALFLAVITQMFSTAFRGISSGTANGLATVNLGLVESILSAWFWILACIFLACFYATGRLENKTLRVLLFWIPTITTTALGFGFWVLLRLLLMRFGWVG